MLKFNGHILAMAALLFGLLSVSCDFDDNYQGHDDGVAKEDVKLTFCMSFAFDATRVVNDSWADYDPQAPGSDYENAIDPSSFQIKICDADGNIIGDVDNVIVSSDDSNSKIYAVTGTWINAAGNLSKAKKIMVFANCGTSPITAQNVASLSFVRSATTSYIPMWGVASITELKLGKSNNIGTIDLLRAMAKVSISLDEDMAERGFALGDASMLNLNTKGFVLPKTYASATSTKDIRFDGSLNVLESWTESAAFNHDNADQLVIYVPEYDNHSMAPKATVALRLLRDGVEEGEYTLKFCDYNEGEPVDGSDYDIQRNHHYEYVVTKKDSGLLIQLQVLQWKERRHDTMIM